MNPLQFSGFPQNEEPPSNDDDDLSAGFLNGIEEADRPIVEKYLKNWNGEVTKRFQGIHQQYAPYKNIGMDPETLANAAYLYSQLDANPVEMYKKIHRALKESDMWEDPEEEQQPVGGNQAPLPEYEGIPSEFLNEFKQTRAELAQLREMTQGFVSQQQEAQENQMLDSVLDQMHTHFGDFDDEWILTRLARGKSPDEAFQEYSKFVEGISGNNRQRKPAPNVFSGSGGIPAGQVDRTKMNTPQGRKDFIAAALEAAQS